MVREEIGAEGSLQEICLEDLIRKHVSKKHERGEFDSSNWLQLGVVIYIYNQALSAECGPLLPPPGAYTCLALLQNYSLSCVLGYPSHPLPLLGHYIPHSLHCFRNIFFKKMFECVCLCVWTCRVQRVACVSRFTLSPRENKVSNRLAGVALNAFTHGAISLAQEQSKEAFRRGLETWPSSQEHRLLFPKARV